jgi:hypothetical protein
MPQVIEAPERKWLDAGAVLNINGPKGSMQLVRNDGVYSKSLISSQRTEDLLTEGTYFIDNGQGGADVGSFRATVNVVTPLAWSNPDPIIFVERDAGVTVTWSGADPNGLVSITGHSINGEVGAAFTCAEHVRVGRFTVPPIVLSSLPLSQAAVNQEGSPSIRQPHSEQFQ